MSLVPSLQVTVQPGMILSDSLFGTAIFQGDNATGFAAGGGGEGAPAAGERRSSAHKKQTHVRWCDASNMQLQNRIWVRLLPAEAVHSWAVTPPCCLLSVRFCFGAQHTGD